MKHLFRAKSFNGEIMEGYLCIDELTGALIIQYKINGTEPAKYTSTFIDPDTVVYLPNEELIKRWESQKERYRADTKNKDFPEVERRIASAFLMRISGCISELKEVEK